MINRNRHSIRLRGYNYSSAGDYFITICVQYRQCLFGEIKNNIICLSEIGFIVHKAWSQLPLKYPHITIGKSIIMPNHMHGIIRVGAGSPCPYNGQTINPGRGNPAPTIGSIMGFFKYTTTKIINQIQNTPCQKFWQRNYWEHIIRGEKEHYVIEQYIQNNVSNWETDALFLKSSA